MDEKTALLFAKTKEFQYIVNKTEGFIKWALAQVKNPYVACSFGKDSAVMLDLVLKQKSDIEIRIITHPETKLLDNYDEVINHYKKKRININEIYLDRNQLFESKKDTQKEALESGNHDSFFVGLRSDESVARRITLHKDGKFYKMKSGKIRICPVAWWNINHISAYLYSNNIIILNKYKDEGMNARTTTGLPHNQFLSNTLDSLKRRDIQSYTKLIQIYPDAKYFT